MGPLPGPAINIMFNRNVAEVFEWRKPLLYLGMMAYLITPAALWLAERFGTGFAQDVTLYAHGDMAHDKPTLRLAVHAWCRGG